MRVVSPLLLVALVLFAAPAAAQYAEVARPLPSPSFSMPGLPDASSSFTSAVQIGRRLFVSGPFNTLAPPTGGAVAVDITGTVVPRGFPFFSGIVRGIAADGFGGWFVVGDFGSVDGQPFAGFARVAADRTVDERYRVVADGAIRLIAVAHNRIYLVGDFTTLNGAPRRGLAALDLVSGQVTSWGQGFDPRVTLSALSASSIGVYVTGVGHVWGFDAASGRVLFDKPAHTAALAASSARVYLTASEANRRVYAIDPLSGVDVDWTLGLSFEYLPATYGLDGTDLSALLLDGGRLYLGGRFLSTRGHSSLAAVDAATGAAVNWRPVGPGNRGDRSMALFKVGPALVARYSVGFVEIVSAFDAATAATLPFAPRVQGPVTAVAAAPEGAILGGSFNGVSGGVTRPGLASIDLDTRTVDDWTPAFPSNPLANPLAELATDGTSLFGHTEGSLGGTDARVLHIDPQSGAITAERTFPSLVTRIRAAGAALIISTLSRETNTSEIGEITIADWSYRPLATVSGGQVMSLDIAGDTIFLGGNFTTVGGQSRPRVAAVHRVTGAVLPWRPAPDGTVEAVRTAAGRVWVGGGFRRVGGQRRRGLAELDAVTGAALGWNPHIDSTTFGGVVQIHLDGTGHLYASTGAGFGDTGARFAAGQEIPPLFAYDVTTGRRLPWRPTATAMTAVLPDCLLVAPSGCLGRAIEAPANLQVSQSGGATTLTWTLQPSPARSGVRVEFGTGEGRADLRTVDLPPDARSYTIAAPPGGYLARVRALGGPATSLSTPDVSFAVGPSDRPAAPLDFTAVVDGPRVTFAWHRPTPGAPPRYEIEAGTARGSRDIGALPVAGAAMSLALDAPPGVYWSRLVAVNDAGRSVATPDVRLDLAPAQLCSNAPAQHLTASVSGRRVTLAWQPPDDAPDTPQQIVAGSAPGLGDLATLDVPPYVTTVAVDAPPGTYFVRLQPRCFGVATSNEVQVVVP